MSNPVTVVARSVSGRHRRSALIWGGSFALLVVSSVTGYSSAYPKVSDRLQLQASLGDNAGVRALFGEASHLDTVGGFTAWRSTVLVMLVGGVWGLLLATKALRGEEDEGRIDALLSGPLTRLRGTAAILAGLGTTMLTVYLVVAIAAVAAGRGGGHFSVSAALWFALTLTIGPTVFVAVGALASQIAPTRRAASTIAGVAFGAAFVLRVIADAGSGGRWLSWLTPFGWVERMRALTGTNITPLLPTVVSIIVLVGATLWLSEHRDVGGAILPDRPTAEPRTRLLNSPSGLTVRLWRGTTIGWAIGLALMGLAFGMISKSVSDAVSENEGLADVFKRLGAGQFSARAYLGVTFIFLSALLGVIAGNFVASSRSEEADERLEHVIVRPVSPVRWLLDRLVIATIAIVLLGLVSGIGGWLGIVAEDAGVGFGRMVLAGLNLVPPALFVLGVGTLAFGLVPRWAAPVAYAVVAWSFFVEFVGAAIKANHWILDTSLLHHLAPAPATDPRWWSCFWLTVLGLAAAVGGTIAFHRRDAVPA
jgi:ABC-2 type transport system permease protein